MKVKWLLESDVFEEGLEYLQQAITDQGMEYKICNYVPFQQGGKFLDLFEKTDCVVFYGSLQFASQVQKYAPWIPGVYRTLANYDCTYYYPRLNKHLLNEKYIMLPFGELERRKDFLFSVLSEDNCLFVRPSSGYKTFTGKVVSQETWKRDVELFGFYEVKPEELVVVANPQNLTGEWRLVVVEGKIITASQYRNELSHLGGLTKFVGGAPDDILAYAQQVLDETQFAPDPVWCLDMCRTLKGEIKVLEIGCFSCAGLYMCNKEAIVKEIGRIALREWEEYYSDQILVEQ